jgi:serine/threonine protein kinase/tetratricopeptide (TPR) repeat protein
VDGNAPRPEELLPRWPGNPEEDPDVASLLFEDFLRRRHTESTDLAEYEERFPSHRDSLADLVRRHAVLCSVGAGSGSGVLLALPAVGDELFGFRLRRELGRGAFAHVFLAEQPDLASRPVVLKVSGIEGDEPQTLAQLQHTHIVPIYSVHEDARAGLRAVCMPYFGGANLSRVLQVCWSDSFLPTSGEQLVRALEVAQATPPASEKGYRRGWDSALAGDSEIGASSTIHGQGPIAESPSLPRESSRAGEPASLPPCLARLKCVSYIEAVVWMVARLADGLQHAHDRGVLHRDIKPANILISSAGEPMLLDFNLAQNQNPDHARAQATLGGTVAYMAPEHLRALAGRDPALARQVDQRADIYALGMILFELLTGRRPFYQRGSYTLLAAQMEALAVERSRTVPSLRRSRPDVPWGLESIVRKCLLPDPAERYQRADQLAADLDAFLSDRPLKHAPELSWVERGQKWIRRHPRLASSGSVAVLATLLLVLAGVALTGMRGHLTATQSKLASAEALKRKQDFEAGTVRALCLVNTLVDLPDHRRQGLAACEQTLSRYEVLEREDWQERPAWRQLNAEERQALGEDVRELLLLLAAARTRETSNDPSALREALILVDRAEAVAGLGASRAVWEERAHYLGLLGDAAGAEAARAEARKIEPASARDHYLLAAAYVRSAAPGEQESAYERAVSELDRALELNRQHYWSAMQRGICHQELGEYAQAAGDFGACIGLWPDFAWGYFNRGYVYDRCGKKDEAIADYSAALARDDRFVLAYLNRGLAYLERQNYRAALDDLKRAGELGHDEPSRHAGLGVALEGLGRTEEADAAFAEAFRRDRALPGTPASRDDEAHTRLLWVYGFAVSKRLPERARQAFDEILQKDPDQPQALYGRAMLLVEQQGDVEEAIRLFSRALTVSPDFSDARRFRAVLLARIGQFEPASQDINRCLEQASRSGPTLYAAACVEARFAEKLPPAAAASHADQAFLFLRQAFARGYGKDRAGRDPDLATLRNDPRFPR